MPDYGMGHQYLRTAGHIQLHLLNFLFIMKHMRVILFVLSLLFSGAARTLAAQSVWPEGVIGGLRHTGAVHFYAKPGKLEVTVYRQGTAPRAGSDRGLIASLTGPDGALLAEAGLEDVQVQPLQSVTLAAEVENEGVYTLFFTANQDQYLTSQQIGFSTNAEKFMINSGVGHTDTKREEPIQLTGDDRPFSVFFTPNHREVSLSVSQLGTLAGEVTLRNPSGVPVRSEMIRDGAVRLSGVPADQPGLWELRLPAQRGRILIDGLNHEFDGTRKPLPVWTTDRKAYFDLGAVHWLLAPRRVSAQVQKGDRGSFEFSVFNNTGSEMPVRLHVKPVGDVFRLLSADRRELVVAPGKEQKIQVSYVLKAPLTDQAVNFYVLAEEIKTGLKSVSLAEIRPENKDISMGLPIRLRLFEHDQFQFSHKPGYPRDNQFYFDRDNRPWMIGTDGIRVLTGKGWTTLKLPLNGKISYPYTNMGSDREGNMYAVAEAEGAAHLVRVNAATLKPAMLRLPAGGGYYLETFMGGKESVHLPVLTRYLRDSTKKELGRWGKVHKLVLYVPEYSRGALRIRDSVLVSDNCVGMSAHSGMPNTMASDGDLVHLVWGETSPPEKKDPGVPTYTITYDRKNRKLGKPVFLAYSPPVNDAHNISSILVSKDGRRHVVIGAHGRPFQYLSAPRHSDSWSSPVNISTLGQTYVGAVMDPGGRIHLVCRVWRDGRVSPGRFEAALYYQRMEADGTWSEQVPMALPPLPGYSIYYQRAMMDRKGNIMVSFGYWSTWSAYRESYRNPPTVRNLASYRMVLESPDGKRWNTLTERKLLTGMGIAEE